MPRKKELKDFSYHPIVVRLVRFNQINKELLNGNQTLPSIDDINTLNKIEKIHGFSKGALIEYFYDLDIFIAQIKSTTKQIPRDCDKKALLNELVPLVKNFLHVINNDYAGSLTRKELYKTTKFYVYPLDYNYLHHIQYALNFLLKHITCKITKKKLGNYGNELIKHVEKLNACLKRGGLQLHYAINRVNNDTYYNEKLRLIDFIEESLKNLLKRIETILPCYTKKTGKPYDAVKHNLLIKLFWIYEDGTKKTAHIYWSEHGDYFTGAFADFLYDCAHLLIKYFLSPNDTYDSIASMARETLAYYRTLPYSKK